MNRDLYSTSAISVIEPRLRIELPETIQPDAPTLASAPPCGRRFKSRSFGASRSKVPRHAPARFRFEHALHIKSAEFWLLLGEPLEALAELENLPLGIRLNSWVHKLHAAATRASKEFQGRSEI